jgi:formate/nitrite transporter FocA (FNT family)
LTGGTINAVAVKRARANASTKTPDVTEPELEEAFDRLVAEGESRLKRSTMSLLTTGLLGGVDVGFGVLAYLVVEHITHNVLLAGLGFSLGFVALLLGRSELFTENFLVPVMTLVAGKSGLAALARLWGLTLVTNLAGGWIISWLIITARPDLKKTAIEVGSHYADLGVSLQSFTLAVLAGAVITLMTRMQHATDNLGVQLVPAVLFSALLAGGQLFHCVLDSLFMFAALVAGAPFGYLDWLEALGWSALGNVVGGIGLVTAIRVLQVPHRVAESSHEDN